MRKESLDFLRDLVDAPSPSGFEGPAQKVWMRRTRPWADSVRMDVHGNAIAALNPKGNRRVMLAGHCDEIGFMVKYIGDDGFVSFAPIGGVDIQVAAARRVVIHSRKGRVPGVVGRKPIHLMDRDKPPAKAEWHSLWFDIGAGSRKEAEDLIELGDPVTFEEGFLVLGKDKVSGRAFDDKAGAFVVSETLRLMEGKRPAVAVFAVSTVQEELGLRGATTAAYAIDPQVGIAVDVTFASDHPEVDKKMVGEIILGKGPVIARGANINPRVFERLVAAAKKNRIPYQVEPNPRATGTDANVMQLNKGGVAAGLISIPNRYMHTPVEVVSLADLENAARLLAAFVLALTSKDDFTPFPVRVIAGEARGRRLLAPPGNKTRPTPDRVREALFSILGGSLAGERVVDLFAGTGALGIEALSRGAEFAVFVERDRSVAGVLRGNLEACGFAPRARVVVASVEAFLRAPLPEGTTLVFADPPYEGEEGPAALSLLGQRVTPQSGVLVVFEHSTRHPPPVPPRFAVADERRYGETCLLFLRPAQGG